MVTLLFILLGRIAFCHANSDGDSAGATHHMGFLWYGGLSGAHALPINDYVNWLRGVTSSNGFRFFSRTRDTYCKIIANFPSARLCALLNLSISYRINWMTRKISRWRLPSMYMYSQNVRQDNPHPSRTVKRLANRFHELQLSASILISQCSVPTLPPMVSPSFNVDKDIVVSSSIRSAERWI